MHFDQYAYKFTYANIDFTVIVDDRMFRRGHGFITVATFY